MPLDYGRMHMQSYYIHYPPIYRSYASQRPISDNLVKKDINCSKECEKDLSTAEVVSLRLVSHQKKKTATDAQKGVHGTTSGDYTSEVGDHEAGMEA